MSDSVLYVEEGREEGEVSGSVRRAEGSRMSNNREVLLQSLNDHVTRYWLFMKKNTTDYLLKPFYQFRYSIFSCTCFVAFICDAQFGFIQMIDNEKKCIGLDKDAVIKITVFRLFIDFLFVILSILSLLHNLKNNERKRAWILFLLDVFIFLPVPEVLLIWAPFQWIRGDNIWFPFGVLLLQVAAKYFRNASWINYWVNRCWLNFFTAYMLIGQGIGAIFYYGAIIRETECWKEASNYHTGRVRDSLYCDDSLEDYSFLNDFCPQAIHDSGIFRDFFQSGILEITHFEMRYLFSLRWGLQNLSSLAQNLQTDPSILDNILLILILVLGIALFSYFIGRIQTYLQFEDQTSLKTKQNMMEIEEWMHFRKLSENIPRQVMEHFEQFQKQDITGVNKANFLNYLPTDLRRIINRQLCLQLLKKVKEFESWSEAMLKELCDYVRPDFYNERTQIIKHGDPIDEMIFVLQGTLRTYTTTGSSMSAEPNSRIKYLQKGDFCGEQLVPWAEKYDASFDFPISSNSIKALTKVEAFVLMAEDLQYVFIKHTNTANTISAMNRVLDQEAGK